MPRYVKGQRQPGQGGRRNPPGGRPTKAQVAEKESLRQAIERKREERADEFAEAYLVMAKDDPATMRHFIDKVLPHKIEVESHGTVDRQAILAIIATPDAQGAVEKLTEAIAKSLASSGNGNGKS